MLSTKKEDIHKITRISVCSITTLILWVFLPKISTMQGLLLNFMGFLTVPTLSTEEHKTIYFILNAVKKFFK